jgi:voltage-gated potassium channel
MAIYLIVVLVVLVLQIGGVWVLKFESQSPDANIKTGGDSLWWAFVTITTVGYGDRFPVTTGGRLIGMALMVCGVGIFSVFTGFIANSFLAPRKKKEEEHAAEPSDPKAKIAEIKQLLEEQEEVSAVLKSRLEEIEKML